MKQVCDLIKEYRKKEGITLSELSNRTGIGLSLIKQYEYGYKVPKIKKVVEISKGFQHSDDFMNDYFKEILNKETDEETEFLNLDQEELIQMVRIGQCFQVTFKEEMMKIDTNRLANYLVQYNQEIINSCIKEE